MNSSDEPFIRRSIELSRQSVQRGNQPFGACLVKDGEVLLEAENSIYTHHDLTRHAERMLSSLASQTFDKLLLTDCTLYTSTEPCAMCAGAIYWAGISRVVYSCSQEAFAELAGKALDIPCRDVFAYANRPIEVVGPVLEAEALTVHKDYWPLNQDVR